MKTALLNSKNSALSIKIISILFMVVLGVSNMSSQTSVRNFGNKAILIPTIHYQQKTKSVNTIAVVKVYTIMIAKTFPTIESGEKQVLTAMDDSETFNYDEVFITKVNTPVNKLTENTALVINYKIQKQTNS